MSNWIERVQSHRVWSLMSELGPLIDRAMTAIDVEVDTISGFERLRAVLAYCGKRLGGGDPLLVLPAALEAMAGAFESQKTEIQAFTTDRNPAHVVTANTAADNALLTAFQLPGLLTSEEQIESTRHMISYRNSIEDLAKRSEEARKKATAEIQELNQQVVAFRDKIENDTKDLTKVIESKQGEITKLAADQQKQFTEAQDSRSKTFNDTLLKASQDQQGQFSTAQENRNAKFADLIADYTKKLSDEHTEFTKRQNEAENDALGKRTDLYGKFVIRGEQILKDVQKHREDVEKLVGVIGEVGITSGYQTQALKSRNQMWFWQGMSVASMVTLIVIGFRVFLPAILGELKWEGVVARLFLTITIGVLAAYSVSQADRFFQMEKYNRKLALELAAIDPFIAFLPQDEKDKFKLEMARKTFAQEDPVTVSKSPATTLDVVSNSKQVQQLLDSIPEVLKILAKKGS
jgi:hypothetical protein